MTETRKPVLTRAYVGVGANIGDRLESLQRALVGIEDLGPLVACSSVYETMPWGEVHQPRFLNLVCAVDTALDPTRLLDELKRLEGRVGRRPGPRWGPRIVDLDILAYGTERVETDRLVIPHPRLAERAFVLAPLAEVAPHFHVPGIGTVAHLLAALPEAAMEAWIVAPPGAVWHPAGTVTQGRDVCPDRGTPL